MKTLRLAAIAATALLASSLPSCQEADKEESRDTLEFELAVNEEAFLLLGSAKDYDTETDLSMACRSSLLIPTRAFGADLSELRDSILTMAFGESGTNRDSLAGAYFRTVTEEVGYEIIPDSLSKPAADSLSAGWNSLNVYDGFVAIQGEINTLTAQHMSYVVKNSFYYPRAAHGMSTTFFINFDFTLGKIVTLSDLFTPEGIKALPAILRKKALSMRNVIGPTEINALPQNDNFYLDSDNSLVFVFQPYEVASYAQGNISIPIEAYNVDGLLSPFGKKLLLME